MTEQILRRNTTPIRMRNYGRIIQDMIAYACTIEDKAEREALVVYIAQCMRQKNLVWNKDQESGMARVEEDIERLSNGVLNGDFEAFRNLQNQPVAAAANGGGKKKKR